MCPGVSGNGASGRGKVALLTGVAGQHDVYLSELMDTGRVDYLYQDPHLPKFV